MLAVRPRQDPGTAEAVVSDASSRRLLSQLNAGEFAKRPVRPPRPALLRSLEEQRADAQPVAEEHNSISFSHSKGGGSISRPWEDTKLPSHPVRADPKLKVEKMLEPARREPDRKVVKAAVAAIGNLVQEQLQMKYGVSLDVDDFIRKVDSLCRAQLTGEDWDPQQIAARILELRLEPRTTESFESLTEEVTSMLGTSSAVAVASYDLSSEPLVSFAANQLDYATRRVAAALGLGTGEPTPLRYLSLHPGKASHANDVPLEPVVQEANIPRQAGPGPATLSRADSPETPPAARMRKESWRQILGIRLD
eukprot:Skav211385  [mRNA]  locus=scaffold2406:220483:232172:- [translate_table: standard]